MHSHAIALLVVLPEAEGIQDLLRLGRAARVQRMPAILLGARHDLTADDGTHCLLFGFILQHGDCLRQADLLGRRSHIGARLFVSHEQSAGQPFPGTHPVRVTDRPQGYGQVGHLFGEIQQCTHVGVGLAGSRIEEGVQMAWLATRQHLSGQGHGYVTQFDVSRRPPHAQEAIHLDMVAVEQLFAAHVLVACGDIAFANVEFVRPAWDGVFVEADQGVIAVDQVPRAGATTEGIDLIPGQVATPGTDKLTPGNGQTPGEQGEAAVGQLLQMKDAFEPDHGSKSTGQQAST